MTGKLFKILLAGICAVSITTGCKSREEKALDTIKDEMFKTLYDFESYQVVDTKIDSLKMDCYGDTVIFDKVQQIWFINEELNKIKKEVDDALSTMRIWGGSTYYSATARKEMEEAQEKYDTNMKEWKDWIDVWKNLENEIKEEAATLDNAQYGWLVTHKFRCKTRGGNSTLATYVYLMDDDCKTIYRVLDEDNATWDDYKAKIDAIMTENTDSIE